MNIELTQNQVRVLGCLLEKSVITPEQYPLTLNALTNACNQKSSRDPVLSLDPGLVQRTARELSDKHLTTINENFKSQVEKYQQRFCNTPFADHQFSEPEFAVICLLLLRGSQTPGELKARSGRLYEFVDNQEVSDTLTGLMDREGGPLVARLPRRPGRRDHEYAHLFSGAIASVPEEASQASDRAPTQGRDQRLEELEARVGQLEAQLATIQESISRLGAIG